MQPFISSIQVGRPQNFQDDRGQTWTSAIAKSVVTGKVRVRSENLEGDEQADLVHHGGPDKAILGYSSSHFPFWREQFPDWEVTAGSFGENLTIEGQVEQEVCVGDIYRIGTAHLQVSQPRQPCWKLTRRWAIPKLALQVQRTGFTGWYFRVLEEGWIEAGDVVELLERPSLEITISHAHQVMHAKPRSRRDDLQLAQCPQLSKSWRKQLRHRAEKFSSEKENKRLLGSAETKSEALNSRRNHHES